MARRERLAWVRYEELVADPIGEMKRLYQELKLSKFDAVREPMENHARAVAGYKRNRFVISSAQKARIERCWGSLLKAKHYTWPGEYLRVEN